MEKLGRWTLVSKLEEQKKKWQMLYDKITDKGSRRGRYPIDEVDKSMQMEYLDSMLKGRSESLGFGRTRRKRKCSRNESQRGYWSRRYEVTKYLETSRYSIEEEQMSSVVLGEGLTASDCSIDGGNIIRSLGRMM